MKHIKLFESFERNLTVTKGQYGWDCKYKCDIGTGRALIMDSNTSVKGLPQMKQGEMYLFGIDTNPMNSGIGKRFLLDIFDHFNLDMVYLPSNNDHPVWNKIATKLPKTGDDDRVTFSLSREQLNK